jgi:hypothetical protein
MQQINEKSHYSTLISSLNKEYKKTKVAKVLTPNDIYLLDTTYNLLNGCCLELSDLEREKLLKIYNNILYSSKVICNNNYQGTYQMSKKDKFIQAEKTDCNTIPVKPKIAEIYYWQEESPTITIQQIIDKSNIEYINSKDKDSIIIFNSGKNINYINVGRICFAIINSKESDNYHIYDYLNNDITTGFTKIYLTDIEIILFISNNIYAEGTMNIKIKLLSNEVDSGIFNDVFNDIFN